MGLPLRIALWFWWKYKQIRMALRIAAYRRVGCRIGRNVRFFGDVDGVNPDKVTIGDNTVLATRAHIIAHDPTKENVEVHIGANCYVGYAALILPGVTVGDNCIIGAGSVVTRDVPEGHIAAGNPARILRKRDEAELAGTLDKLRRGAPVSGLNQPEK